MKKCPKCGRTSPPALAVCPRCKTPFNAPAADRSAGYRPSAGPRPEAASGAPSGARTVVTTSVLVVLVVVLAVVLFKNWNRLIAVYAQYTEKGTPSPGGNIVRPANFNELLGTWSGREINRGSGWTFSFSDGYNVYASGPEGWYRGKASIHWDIGSDKDGMRVPPGAGILDVDIGESSVGSYAGKTSVGAFSVYGGTTLKLCSGEPGKTKRPVSYDPVSGIRCFELAKTSGVPIPPPAQDVAGSAGTAPGAASAEDGETRAARDAFKQGADALRSGDMDSAKKLFSRAALAEMEQSGQADMAMGMLGGINIDEFQAVRQGDRITFKQSQKQGDATMTMSLKMVKEDGQWKLGK